MHRADPLSPAADRTLRILALVLCLVAACFLCVQPQTSNDFWLQAKVGEWIVQSRSIPETLVFPFTQAQDFPFHAHEWLASLLFHGLVQLAGEDALPLWLGLLGCVFFALAYRLALLRSPGNRALAAVCALCALVLENFRHFLRPELLALLLFCALLHTLERLQAGRLRRQGLAVFACTALWANVHGSFVLAPMLVGIYLLGPHVDRALGRMPDGPKPLPWAHGAGLMLLCCGALLLNPIGWNLLIFALSFGASDFVRQNIVEWFPALDPRLRHILGVQLALAGACALLALCACYARRLRSADLLLLALVLALSWRANRFLVYVPVCWVLLFPQALASTLYARQTGLWRCCCALALATVLLCLRFGNVNGNHPYSSSAWGQLNAGMRQVLENEDLRGNVLCSYDFGAELVYRAYPRMRPSIDSRIDSYGEVYYAQHEALLHDAAALSAFLQRYGVQWMLLTTTDADDMLRSHALVEPGWTLYARSGQALLLHHSP